MDEFRPDKHQIALYHAVMSGKEIVMCRDGRFRFVEPEKRLEIIFEREIREVKRNKRGEDGTA